MASERAKELRQQGIAAAKAGNKEQARQLLQQSIRLDGASEPAWLWLASVARDQRERMFCLRKILEINPANDQAAKALRQLEEVLGTAPLSPPDAPQDTSPVRRVGAPESKAAAPRNTQEMLSQAPDVPLPARESVFRAAAEAESIARMAVESPTLNVNWVRKTRGRVGEGDIWWLRAYIAGASVAAMAVLCLGSFIVVSNTPELARVVFVPTRTPTFTPTFTPTSTPGLTPTPSATPRVAPRATGTVPPLFPTADVYAPQATDVYPEAIEAPLRGAISLIDRGELDAALPTLASERLNTSARFNAAPYYWEAIAQAKDGQLGAALNTLRDAEERLPEAPNENFQPLVDAGFAYVLNLQAEAALADDNLVRARQQAGQAQARAEEAVARDPRLAQGHIELARSFYFQGQFQEAIDALDTGLEQPALQFNTALIAEKARLYFAEGDYQQAERQAYLVLYADPSVEIAHQIQVNSALIEEDFGLAVLRAQAYLFYYPGKADAWRMLGDARRGEGNIDLAIAAYSQALSAEQDPRVTVQALTGRAECYLVQRRYDEAQADFTEAVDTQPDDSLRALRMQAAYLAGDLETALKDAGELIGSETVSPAVVSLIRGQALVDLAVASEEPVEEGAIGALEAARAGADERTLGVIDEYIARAQLTNGDLSDALASVNDALGRAETVERHYLRGQILEARNQDAAAIQEYEWVLAWSAIYPVPFADDLVERLAALRDG